MSKAKLTVRVATVACSAICAVSAVLAAQGASQTLPGAEAAQAIAKRATVKGFVPPKTPWGDPDISGVFTTKDEANTPFERPAEWAGRKMEDITAEEFEAAIAKRQQDAVETAPFAGGGEPEQGVAIAVPIHWFDNLAARDSRPWFVLEPDGKVPPLSAEGQKRRQPRRGPNGGARNSYHGPQFERSLHRDDLAAADHLRELVPDPADAGLRGPAP